MIHSFRSLALAGLFAALPLASASAQSTPGQPHPAGAHAGEEAPVVHFADKLVWNDLGLIPGAKIAVLQGDPGAEGYYTLRLMFPAGTRLPAHWHPKVEYATVVSGTALLGMGDKEDPAAMAAFPAGSFILAPANMPHYGKAVDDVVIQLSGPGPYELEFVNPADDPRKKK